MRYFFRSRAGFSTGKFAGSCGLDNWNFLLKCSQKKNGIKKMRPLPDFGIAVREASDFIMESPLARKAFTEHFIPQLANIIRDLIKQVHLMAINCQLSEFTDHGLPHICSIVKRISDWGKKVGWIENLTTNEATILLLSGIVHDIGMLSQNIDDLDDDVKEFIPKGISEVPIWVRKTHDKRIFGILKRVLICEYVGIEEQLRLISQLGRSHSVWPWKFEEYFKDKLGGLDKNRIYALCSIIAISDLLEEDCERCDTDILLKHRQGTTLNKSHWIRHGLTRHIEISKDEQGLTKVKVFFYRPEGQLDNHKLVEVYKCLMNHIRIILLYNEFLEYIGAQIPNGSLEFSPHVDLAEKINLIEVNVNLDGWQRDLKLKYSLAENLIDTFFPIVRNEYEDAEMERQCEGIMDRIDLNFYRKFISNEPLTEEERLLYVMEGLKYE